MLKTHLQHRCLQEFCHFKFPCIMIRINEIMIVRCISSPLRLGLLEAPFRSQICCQWAVPSMPALTGSSQLLIVAIFNIYHRWSTLCTAHLLCTLRLAPTMSYILLVIKLSIYVLTLGPLGSCSAAVILKCVLCHDPWCGCLQGYMGMILKLQQSSAISLDVSHHPYTHTQTMHVYFCPGSVWLHYAHTTLVVHVEPSSTRGHT